MEKLEQEQDLAAQIESVFDRCPQLCGFSIAERLVRAEDGAREWELYVSNIDAYPRPGPEELDDLLGELCGLLAEVLSEQPQAADLLPGRTFARVWH